MAADALHDRMFGSYRVQKGLGSGQLGPYGSCAQLRTIDGLTTLEDPG
jgi:hypothetical protein